MQLRVSLVCVLQILSILQIGSCAPAAQRRVERTASGDKIENLKEKLQTLQALLNGMKQSPTEPVATTTTTASPGVDERKVQSALELLIDKLTPEEVQALKSVREKLDEVSLSEFTIDDEDAEKNLNTFQQIEPKTVTGKRDREQKDGAPFTSEELRRASSNPIDNPNSPIVIEDPGNGPEPVDRQLMDDVETRLISDIRYAHAHGIKLEQIFTDLKDKSKNTGGNDNDTPLRQPKFTDRAMSRLAGR